MAIRRKNSLDTVPVVEALGWKFSPTFLSIGGLAAATSVQVPISRLDDPLPGPEPPPEYPGGEPPIEYPVLPPSGPAGPGFEI